MKFMLFAASALAATTFQKRQLSVVQDAISSISSATQTLRDGINSFSGIADVGSLQDAAAAVITAVNDGNSAVDAIEPLGSEAAGLATPIQDLATLVSGTVDDLVAKKQAFIDAGVAEIVLSTAQDLRTAATTFRTTTLSKVPENLQDLGNQISQPIVDALDRAVNEFSGLPSGGDGGETTTTTGGDDATTTSGGDSYTTPPPATTTTGGAGGATSTTSGVATYTGAAIANAANGYGAVAMAVLAGAAML